MTLESVEQDHAQPDTLPKAAGCTLNTPDQASGEWGLVLLAITPR